MGWLIAGILIWVGAGVAGALYQSSGADWKLTPWRLLAYVAAGPFFWLAALAKLL